MQIDGIVTKADYCVPTEPRDYLVTITNGSASKTAMISARGYSVAWRWAAGFAAHTFGQAGTVAEVNEREEPARRNGRETGTGFGPSYSGKHRA